jgi:SEC-C motif-containing protein
MQYCPCGTGQSYAECCGPFIAGERTAGTPEQLMRSRYTAYTQANIDYIANTMKSPASDQFDPRIAKEWAERVQWLELDVLKSSLNGSKGFVEFRAYFFDKDKKHTIHELSEFHLINEKWFYMSGSTPKAHVGRNDPCPCGSGKKNKKCCGELV